MASETLPAPADELHLTFVTDRTIQKLNLLYRKKDRPTDVLSFSMIEDGTPAGGLLGELVIAVPTLRRQAKEYGVTVRAELIRLLVHGTLHLFGYDHERVAQSVRMRMKRREAALVHLVS